MLNYNDLHHCILLELELEVEDVLQVDRDLQPPNILHKIRLLSIVTRIFASIQNYQFKRGNFDGSYRQFSVAKKYINGTPIK